MPNEVAWAVTSTISPETWEPYPIAEVEEGDPQGEVAFLRADDDGERMLYVGRAQVSLAAVNGRPHYRVRFGPFARVEEADAMLDNVIAKGQNGARIVVE